MLRFTHMDNRDLATRIEARATTAWSDDECWLCDRHTNRGYVLLVYKANGVTTRRYQHIVAWEMHNAQPVPKGMVVMHTCDNPGCFNPNHLRVGTPSDNIQDSVAKGRHACLTTKNLNYQYTLPS